MSDNGDKDTGAAKRKWCPFSQEWCRGEACALWETIENRTQVGVQRVGVCSFIATNMVLSGISRQNTERMHPASHLQLPGEIFRG